MPSGSLITMPSSPVPASIELLPSPEIAAAVKSIFTGQLQIQDWGSGPREISFPIPPMKQSDATTWLTFISNLKGMVNYFVLPSAFTADYSHLAGINWRLKGNVRTNITPGKIYRFTFDCIEALN